MFINSIYYNCIPNFTTNVSKNVCVKVIKLYFKYEICCVVNDC